MLFSGVFFKTKDGSKWEILQEVSYLNKPVFYRCVCKDKPIYGFKDFTKEQLKGVEFI